MKRTSTPRREIYRQLKETHVGQARWRQAQRLLQADGFLPGYKPSVKEPDRSFVAVNWNDPMRTIFEGTHAISQSGPYAKTRFPLHLVEGLVGSLLDVRAGDALADYGLVMMRPDGDDTIPLVATSPDLASIVNRLRYGTSRRGRDHAIMLEAALGLRARPKRLGALDKDKWLEAALVFEALEVDANDLLDGGLRSHPRSLWLIQDLLAPASSDA